MWTGRLEDVFIRALQDQNEMALASCLRAFGYSDNTLLAVSVVGDKLLRPFLAREITVSKIEKINVLAHSYDPNRSVLTRVIPGLAVQGKQVSGHAITSSTAAASAPAAADDTSLRGIFERVFAFVESKFGVLCRLTEHSDAVAAAASHDEQAVPFEFQFVAQGCWKEIQKHLLQFQAVLCASGMPDTFLKNYRECIRFLDRLSSLPLSSRSKELLRSGPVTTAFWSKWNVEVYFQLRHQQIASQLERILSASTPGLRNASLCSVDAASLPSFPAFKLPASLTLWACYCACWSSDIFLPRLAGSFATLAVQLFNRYVAWITVGLSPPSSLDAVATAWPAPLDVADVLLLQHDLRLLSACLVESAPALILAACRSYSPLLGKAASVSAIADSKGIDDDSSSQLLVTAISPAFQEVSDHLATVMVSVQSAAARTVSAKCLPALEGVRTIKKNYQMTNRPPPTTHSPYVESVLQPLTDVLSAMRDQHADVISHEGVVSALVQEVCGTVTSRFRDEVKELLDAVHKTEMSLNSLKRLQKGAAGKLASVRFGT